MLNSYEELRQIDVTPYCDTREAKDDRGRTVDIPYLSWAKCVDLLHANGASEVWFEPVETPEGSFVWSSGRTMCGAKEGSEGRACGNYFVKVLIHIDDMEFIQAYPLMNGNYVVYEDTITQLRISNAHARAFVKGVAIRTGLGFSLWLGDKDTEPVNRFDELSEHNPLKVCEYIEQLITAKIRRGETEEQVLTSIGVNKKQLELIKRALNNAGAIIAALRR
jgi:hypothetical protein